MHNIEGLVRQMVQHPSELPYQAPAFDTKAGAFLLPHSGQKVPTAKAIANHYFKLFL